MVDLSPVLVMAAPLDPLSHQFQQQLNSSTPNSSPYPNANPWGTWEELVLGSAVLKHGADNWTLVSQELQSHARVSFSFTPEACRAGYHAIRIRFGANAARDGGSNGWFEELRRQRLAHLKHELDQYDSSIGSLRSKIRRLQSEGDVTGNSLSACVEAEGSEPNEASCAPNPNGDTDACGSRRPYNSLTAKSKEAQVEGLIVQEDRSMGASTSHVVTHGTINVALATPAPTSTSLMKESNGLHKGACDEATGSLTQQKNGSKELANQKNGAPPHANQEKYPPSSSSTLYLSLTKSDSTTSKSLIMEPHKSNHDPVTLLNMEQEGHDIESRSKEITLTQDVMGSHHTVTDTWPENRYCRPANDTASADGTWHARLALQQETAVKVGHMRQGEVSTKQGVSSSLKSANVEGGKSMPKSASLNDEGERRSDESQSLCSPRLTFQHAKRRRRSDGIGSIFKREVSSQADLDDKRYLCKALGEKSLVETTNNLPVESADSTEGKGRWALAMKAASPGAVAGWIKKEMVTCKEEVEVTPRLNAAWLEKDNAKKLAAPSVKARKKNQSSSSTENSLLHEVWGESAEVVDKEAKSGIKRRRLMGRVEGKHKLTDSGDTRDARTIMTKSSSMKTESLSHEASESMQSPGGKYEPDTEAWLQAERLSGDSRYEKSEVGSYVDGSEDISPMSRRNKREPKVLGKHIPLLESLRTICAHRCGHFFRHNQEPEDNDDYFRIVRSPIDLGMIRTKLEEGHYTGSMHFFRDLLLMVSNAMVYYPRDSAESAAAWGLRECVMQEMAHVFETEALVKQGGPSFRKRDSKQFQGQGRRKGGLKLSATTERTSRERDRSLKHSDVSTSNESRRLSHQTFESRLSEGDRPDKGIDAKSSLHVGGDAQKALVRSDCKKMTNIQTPREVLGSLKTGRKPSDKDKEVKESPRLSMSPGKVGPRKEPTSTKLPMHPSREAKLKDRPAEDVVEKKARSGNGGSTSKMLVSSYKAKESANYKAKFVPGAVQEQPVKRGVGRPPKHSQQQGLMKAREVLEVNNSTRKRGRR